MPIVDAASTVTTGTAVALPKGEAVHAAQKCSLCHSVAGKGNSKGALDDVGTKLKADEIRAWIVDAKGTTAKTGATRKPEMKTYALKTEDSDRIATPVTELSSGERWRRFAHV